jgi:hypothetical protein
MKPPELGEWRHVRGMDMNFCNAGEKTMYLVQNGQVKLLKF